MKCFLTVKRKPLHSKVLLVMKLTTLLLLAFTLNVSAKGYGQQKISLKVKKTEISGVLRTIEKQTNYRFLYNDKLEDIREKVSINIKDASLPEVLELLLERTRLLYQVMDSNLVVIKEDPNAPPRMPDVVIHGKVSGEGGASLVGVSVLVKGTTIGTTTNNNGEFTLSVPDANVTLVFSSIGYEGQEIPLNGKTEINVGLLLSTKVIDQVIVVGYGTQRKIDVTGSVAQIKGEEISKQASTNPISALQGKVAGVQITNNGAPGSSPQIRIRGVGTVYGNPNPLYVVDGVWFDDISFLNPADIETLSVLKDASAESIYGIRAANGVVLITTKKGKSGQAVVNYNFYTGWQKVTNDVEMANANQYATLYNELGRINGSSTLMDPSKFAEGTDWYHQVLRNAFVMNHQISVSGGGEKSTYNFSLGYLDQDGIVETNNYKRYTARLQNDYQVFAPVKVGYTVTGYYNKSDDIPGSIFRQIYTAGPVVPVFYADGTYGDPNDFSLGGGNNYNPQATIDFFNQGSKNYRLIGNAYTEIKFLKHFTFKTSFGGEYGQGEVRNYTPLIGTNAPVAQRTNHSTLSVSRSEARNWIVENTLSYNNRIGDHSFTVLAGQSAQRYKSYGLSASAENVPNNSEGDLYLRLGTDSTRISNDYGDLSTIASYFGRVNYSYQNKYLLNASIRADGSSKFSGSQRWGYFPSVGVGWVITKENFMASQRIFNNLKLRGSWGKIGNASVPSNLSTLTVTQFTLADYGGGYGTSNSIATIVPPTTYWELGEGTDIGVEASLLKSKLYVEADYYNRKTKNAIFDIPILGSLGTTGSSIIGNQATFQNTGFEFTINWKDDINKDLSYSISANVGINNNKVLETSTGANPIYGGGTGLTGGALATRTLVGRPIGEFYGYQVTGIFQNATQIAASVQPTAKPGDFIYMDQNKDGQISGLDRIPLGNPNPKYSFGINTGLTYKQFDLSVDIQGVADVKVYNANLGWRYGNENFTKDFYDNRWHGEGTTNTYPSVNIGGGNNYLPNSFYVEDGSYLRIRNMQLGYTLPNNILDRIHIKMLRVYANAQNAFNFFKYRGFSPEIPATNNSPLNAGIDANVYPLYVTYNFGLNITF